MTENRLGFTGVIRTIDRNFALFSGPAEDQEKKKEERVIPDTIWRIITPGMLGGIHEAVKPEETLEAAALRSAEQEFGLHLTVDDIMQPLLFLGQVEQKRNGKSVTFDVWFANVFLHDAHLEKVKGVVVHSPPEMEQFLNEHERDVRPSAVAAIRKTLEFYNRHET